MLTWQPIPSRSKPASLDGNRPATTNKLPNHIKLQSQPQKTAADCNPRLPKLKLGELVQKACRKDGPKQRSIYGDCAPQNGRLHLLSEIVSFVMLNVFENVIGARKKGTLHVSIQFRAEKERKALEKFLRPETVPVGFF